MHCNLSHNNKALALIPLWKDIEFQSFNEFGKIWEDITFYYDQIIKLIYDHVKLFIIIIFITPSYREIKSKENYKIILVFLLHM